MFFLNIFIYSNYKFLEIILSKRKNSEIDNLKSYWFPPPPPPPVKPVHNMYLLMGGGGGQSSNFRTPPNSWPHLKCQ